MVCLATRYRWSKRLDHVLQNTIARGPKPDVNIPHKLNDEINTYGKKTPPHIRINRLLVICLYRNMGSFYNQIQILSSLWSRLQNLLHQMTTSQILQRLDKLIQLFYCHVAKNHANSISNNFAYKFQIVCIFDEMIFQYLRPIDCTDPSGPDIRCSLLSVLSKWGSSQIGFWMIS